MKCHIAIIHRLTLKSRHHPLYHFLFTFLFPLLISSNNIMCSLRFSEKYSRSMYLIVIAVARVDTFSFTFSILHFRIQSIIVQYYLFFIISQKMSEQPRLLSAETMAMKPSNNGNQQNGLSVVLETDKEKKERLWSLWIVYFTMFLISLGFSIVLTGIWPFLDKVR